MSLTKPDLQISFVRLFSKTHETDHSMRHGSTKINHYRFSKISHHYAIFKQIANFTLLLHHWYFNLFSKSFVGCKFVVSPYFQYHIIVSYCHFDVLIMISPVSNGS